MTDVRHVVPLPDSLRHCGCRMAPTRHAMDCAVAIAFDATPLRERPEYELGRSFAVISWDYPLRVTVEQKVEVELDPIAVILAHADEYERFDMDSSYEEWEKPMVWLSEQIEEQLDTGGVSFRGGRRLSHDRTYFDDFREHPRWTPADTDRLNQALASRPDPNQGALEV